DGNIKEVYIYQNGRLIDTCGLVTRYNEATAEQTEADREAYIDQAKYVAQFDSMVKKGKISKVAIVKKDVSKAIKEAEAVPVMIPETDDDQDYSEYMENIDRYGDDAVASV
ncbi:MAG: gamma-glutamyl-gamma-aminobutyrate hydrolase family protein, partial [Roseburia sp.]|nr:gamma-glutamyl-gamma-aminobutyrate hydrolase family protein [Roseburia sp.]